MKKTLPKFTPVGFGASNYKGALVRRGLMVKSGGGYVPAEVFQL